jgi:thiamine-phosphate pyrophosphorylase
VTGRVAGGIGDRHLYLCTPDRPDLEAFLDACISGGVDVVQLRDKTAPDGTVVARGRLAARVCGHHGVPFIVNDRPDLALEVGADGVHVGQEDASPSYARHVLGPTAIVGLSTHAPDELAASLIEPVDYISAGPVSPTPTKPGRPGTGAGYVTAAVQASTHPVFVTGGVTPLTLPALWAAGARHFVVVRWLTEADDPTQAARSLRAVIDTLLGERH